MALPKLSTGALNIYADPLLGSATSPTTSPAASSKPEDSDPNYTLNYEEPLIQLLALFLSGAAIPFAILPDSLTAVLSKIPTSLFADLIFWAADSPLQRTSNPLLAFAVVIAVTVALFVVAVRAFKWDVRK